jgi:hypothetical protein
MRNTLIVFTSLTLLAIGAFHPLNAAVIPAVQDDVQLRAMLEELNRAKTLQLSTLDKPYFIAIASDDGQSLEITGSLGALLSSTETHVRMPEVRIRVGSASLDNTNSVFSTSASFGSLPLDDNYGAIRTALWLVLDERYKISAAEIARKRNALREISDPAATPDFSPAAPFQLLQPIPPLSADRAKWEEIVRNLSGRFRSHPAVTSSSVRMRAISSGFRLVTTEGTVVRVPQSISQIDIRSSGTAADGATVWNHKLMSVLRSSELPDQQQLQEDVDAVTVETEALLKAPIADEYTGPVLFESEAASEMMAQVLTDATRLSRKPVAPPEMQAEGQVLDGVWASRTGSKVTPEWLSIVDDPSQRAFKGQPLAGQYDVDEEGVPAGRVTLVDKGILKSFLLTRQPVRNFHASNGHARLPGAWGAELPVFGNVFVTAAETVPESQMRTKLLEKVKAAGLQYGVVIRRLDFPSTADVEDLQALAAQLQKGGSTRSLTPPLLVYRIYPDGHEELVRGFRFKDFSAKDLRDVEAASDRPFVLNYENNGNSFNWANATSAATTSSVICPSLLFDSVDLDRAQGDGAKPPLVPPPPVDGQ